MTETDEPDSKAAHKAFRLSEADARAVDAALGEEPNPPPERRGGAERALGLFGLLSAPAPSGDLEARTVERVAAARRRATAESVSQHGVAAGSFGWTQGLALAAVVLIGAVLAWPLASYHRAHAERLACQHGLAQAGKAFAAYASAHKGLLPHYGQEPGTPWWRVGDGASGGEPPSNSANLYRLIREGYAKPKNLSCPGNEHSQPAMLTKDRRDWPDHERLCYSYQNQFARKPMRLEGDADRALLADKNPFFDDLSTDFRFRRELPRTTSSPLHERSGQNVLRADGRVSWWDRPDAGGDHIYLMSDVDRYDGREIARRDDAFLVP